MEKTHVRAGRVICRCAHIEHTLPYYVSHALMMQFGQRALSKVRNLTFAVEEHSTPYIAATIGSSQYCSG